MCYRCQICQEVSQPRETLRKYIFYKGLQGRKQISREIPICNTCSTLLQAGIPFATVLRQRKTLVGYIPTIVREIPPIQEVQEPKPIEQPIPTFYRPGMPVKLLGRTVKRG